MCQILVFLIEICTSFSGFIAIRIKLYSVALAFLLTQFDKLILPSVLTSCVSFTKCFLKHEDKTLNRLLALLVKKLQIFVKKILIKKYNFN
ncbi:hypothetical protein D6D54_00065 [Spiroplasma poulsonii]|uniref:Uncharacterized protein n=1 Tax=Spiroplasma poulsonii TaxID=2138 RepID=A0A433ESP3_9MOLU|nr:hypothetical protein D6D54_00065 [Spiroplasma poulsonii]